MKQQNNQGIKKEVNHLEWFNDLHGDNVKDFKKTLTYKDRQRERLRDKAILREGESQ